MPIVLIAIGGLIMFDKIDNVGNHIVGLSFMLVGYLFAVTMTLDRNLREAQETNGILFNVIKEMAEGSNDYRIEYEEK